VKSGRHGVKRERFDFRVGWLANAETSSRQLQRGGPQLFGGALAVANEEGGDGGKSAIGTAGRINIFLTQAERGRGGPCASEEDGRARKRGRLAPVVKRRRLGATGAFLPGKAQGKDGPLDIINRSGKKGYCAICETISLRGQKTAGRRDENSTAGRSFQPRPSKGGGTDNFLS